MKFVDISSVPTKMYHSKECYEWNQAVGKSVPFIYDDVEGTLDIVGCSKDGHDYRLTVEYNGMSSQITGSHLREGKIGNCIKVRTKEFRYRVGNVIKDDKRDLTILRTYRGYVKGSDYMVKKLSYKCNKCGYVNEDIREELIARGSGCLVCAGKVVQKGTNDIPTVASWMVPYFPGGEDEASKYTVSSSKCIHMRCPDCGRISDKPIAISTLHQYHSIGCVCGDGISLPEKFVFQLIKAIGISGYKRQISCRNYEWCGRYRYDGMLQKDEQTYIIEVHGIQHYEHSGFERFSTMTLQDVQENDRNKKELALSNGILEANYIVIDCRKTTLDYMRESILASKLAEILELKKYSIDWETVYSNALKPLPKAIYDYALANPTVSTKEIAELFGVGEGYPAMVLNALGIYGKEERNIRKSKKFYNDNKEQLFREMKDLVSQNPEITVTQIAKELGRNESGIYYMLRKYDHDIDMELLARNAEAERLRGLRKQRCQPVSVRTPNLKVLYFDSVTLACKELEKIYGIKLSAASVSRSMTEGKEVKGFMFERK